jgi:hypothetical protein
MYYQFKIKNFIDCFNRLSNLLPLSLLLTLSILFSTGGFLHAQSLDIPTSKYGISFGNSKNFDGLRLNFQDKEVEKINGINFTIWKAKSNDDAVVNGISLGLVMPGAGYLSGIQIGGVGVSAKKEIKGITFGLLGAGAGESISGISIGGLGIGSGGDMSGIAIGGFGAGCGGNLTGIAIGGFGAGCGGNITGIALGGFGAGAGGNITGLTFGIFGAGCGGNMTGINIGGFGVGCGGELKGITIGGLGAGAPIVKGLTIAGIAAGGQEVKGITIALGMIKVGNEGNLKGFSASAFNQIKGKQTGVSLGIVNYARQLNGFQFGLINYVRDNPKYLRILPILNFHFD